MAGGRLAGALVALLLGAEATSAQPLCTGTATLTVFVDNRSAASTLRVDVEGARAADTVTCAGEGATNYQQTLACDGVGIVRCGIVTGLAPGAWVHRMNVQVPDSAPQVQAQRAVLVAGAPEDVSNALVWTVYPRTVVVAGTSPVDLAGALAQAEAFTATNDAPALVIFDPTVFPGAASPQRIQLMQRPTCLLDELLNRCRPGGVLDGATAGLCFTGSRIVVDALDRNAEPGGVVLSVDTCGREGVRLYGSDNVLRGLVIEGSTRVDPVPPCQLDALAIVGAAARRNRIERMLIVGPTCGDAVSVQLDAGQPDAAGPGDNLIVSSRITGAKDKGLKASFGGVVRIEETCVHDNRNGGIQSTLGGRIHAGRNVVQHNVPGAAQNGLSVGSTTAARSALTTDGNVVRFAGARGLSVTGNAEASFAHDYVADNQFAGTRVDATADAPDGTTPAATFAGVAFACNRNANLTGICSPPPSGGDLPCTSVEDCCLASDGSIDPACVAVSSCVPSGPPPTGTGAITTRAAGRPEPVVSFGDATSSGRNAFTANVSTAEGANFRVLDVDGPVTAQGNQWEHCGAGALCDAASVLANDVVSSGAVVDVGAPPGPRDGTPVIERVRPARPGAGDIVRVYGGPFNAIEGNHLPTDPCAALPRCDEGGGCPTGPCIDGACPCTMDSPIVRQQNEASGANRIVLRTPGGPVLETLYPDAVTPTMLAFRMPFDCFAPLELEVAKRDPDGTLVAVTATLCDPGGCRDADDGTPCDDGSVCTSDDRCLGGTCVSGALLACEGPCLTGGCDPIGGCVPRPPDASCDDGDACTAADHCAGVDASCVSGDAVQCDGPCHTGTCEPAAGCTPLTGLKALTCRTHACTARRLGRKLRRLGAVIDWKLARGETPTSRQVRRLERLLERCDDARRLLVDEGS